jgi:hypothetical protein
MADDRSMTEIIAAVSDGDIEWEDARQHLAALHRLAPAAGCHAMVGAALAQWQQRFLNMGAFSRVYVLDDQHVLKFCRDLTSLQIMARLGAQSTLFPRVDLVLTDQATEGQQVYHMAVVERLQQGHPRWISSVVDAYRRPYRADTPLFASCRLLEVRRLVLNGTIAVPSAVQVALAKALRLLARECANENCLADLRTEQNVMLRKGTEAVFADPTHPVESDDCIL